MKAKDILDAIGDIDRDLIENAEGKRKNKRVLLRILAAAACICVLLAVCVPATVLYIFTHLEYGGDESSRPADVSQNENPDLYKCYITDYALDAAVGEGTLQIEHRFFPKGMKIDEFAQITEIKYEGKTYPCKYKKSGYNDIPYITHEFRLEIDGVYSTLIVDSDMNVVTFYDTLFYKRGVSPNTFTQEEAFDLAKKYASEYTDLSGYSLETFEDDLNTGDDWDRTKYYYCFTKQYQGIDTADRIWIAINSQAVLEELTVTCIGMFDGLPDDLIDKEKLDQTLGAKVASCYQYYFGDGFDGTYEIDKQRLLYAPSGELLLENTVKISHEIYGTRGIRLTVVLQDAPETENSST